MRVDVSLSGIHFNDEKETIGRVHESYGNLAADFPAYSGWVDLPAEFDDALFKDIEDTAEKLREKCELLIVIGIGGSFLGAKAVIEALGGSRDGFPEILFAGFNMSASYLKKVEARMMDNDVCLCVISKSGTTTEPLLTYHILKEKMIERYGKRGASERIYVITGREGSVLRDEAEINGNKTFDVPDDIGGRYSVLSPVGLFPIASAGHDIGEILRGAADMALSDAWTEELLDYAICRTALQCKGKTVEIFEYFEMDLEYFGEWLKQLFCESEGKDGKGVFATCLSFSRDLHSVGQFLQQGNQIFYETLIRVKNASGDFIVPESAGVPYAGKYLEDINSCAEEGVMRAHGNGGIPVISIEIPELNEYNIGQLIYFFEMSCAVSAYAIGVNPFDQPGVEAYKREMKRLVEKL